MPKRIFLLILVVSVFPWPAFAQDEDEKPKVELPDQVMSQVVRRIVRWYFKPANRPREIHFSENGIQASWLPKLKNIEFILLNDNDSLRQEKGVYFFKAPDQTGKTYSIDFGFGDLNCDASGDTWKFKLIGSKVGVWRDDPKRGWGNGCGGNSPPTIQGLSVGDVSPNELPGYQFFAKGKLKGIKLGFSRKEDIEKIFGSSCENTCNYDERWDLLATYYSEEEVYTTTQTNNGVETKIVYFPRPQYYGTLSSISLSPKENLSFSKIIFPRTFAKGETNVIGDSFSERGFEGAVHTAIDTFADGYGLTYNVFDKVTFHNIPYDEKSKQGDLLNIEYKIPDSIEKNFVLIGKILK